MAVSLSVCSGVGGWLCPISLRACRKDTAAFAFMNNAPYSASDADETTFLRMQTLAWIAPLNEVVLRGLSPR